MKAIIMQTDPNAFVAITEVSDILGKSLKS